MLSSCSVFQKLLPLNLFMSVQAPRGFPLELSHYGHRVAFQVLWQQENIPEPLLGMEISWCIIAFLRGMVYEGQSTTISGFGNVDDVSSLCLHLWSNPLTSSHYQQPSSNVASILLSLLPSFALKILQALQGLKKCDPQWHLVTIDYFYNFYSNKFKLFQKAINPCTCS